MLPVRVYEVGEKYGRLTVIERRDRTEQSVRCMCECGELVQTRADRLASGGIKSCGCLAQETRRTAPAGRRSYSADGNPNWRGGMRKHPLYTRWSHMIRRCHDERHKQYVDYGGRSIAVCERWRTNFWAYVADLGPQPSPEMSVDRINNDAGYGPDNCRWATPSQQSSNCRPRVHRQLDRCLSGKHDLTPENVYVSPRGGRNCKQCARDRRAERTAR
jgi:hypothetical protein